MLSSTHLFSANSKQFYCVSEYVVEDRVRQTASCTREHGSSMDFTVFRLISLFHLNL